MSSWLVLQMGSDRQFAGNRGYEDRLGSEYHYDNFVPNHKQLSCGDYLFVCDRDSLLLVGRIIEIQPRVGTKILQRCSVCRTTAIKERRTKTPRFRCNNTHEFERPVADAMACTTYVARYAQVAATPSRVLFTRELRDACAGTADQLAIRRLDVQRLLPLLAEVWPDSRWWIVPESEPASVLAAGATRRISKRPRTQ